MSSDLGVLNKPTVNQRRRGHRGGGRRMQPSLVQKVQPTSPVRAIQKTQSDSDSDDNDDFVDRMESKFVSEKQSQEDAQRRKEGKMWEKRRQKFFDRVRKIENDHVKPIAPPTSGEFDAKPDMVTAYSFEPETRKTEDVLKDYLERRFLVDRLYREQEKPENYVDQLAQNNTLINDKFDCKPSVERVVAPRAPVAHFRMAPVETAPPAPVRMAPVSNPPIPAVCVSLTDVQPMSKALNDILTKQTNRLQLQFNAVKTELLSRSSPATATISAQLDRIQEQLLSLQLNLFNCSSQ